MKKYTCSFCSHIYDEAEGDPGSGIAPLAAGPPSDHPAIANPSSLPPVAYAKTVATIPEPGTAALLALGLGLLSLRSRARSR